MSDEFGTLDDLKNLSLASLVAPELREKYSVRVSTPADLNDVTGTVDVDGEIKGTLRHWILISLCENGERISSTIVGYADFHPGAPFGTSDVKVLDAASGLVRTRNSLYRLEEPELSPPGPEFILFLGQLFFAWGVNRVFRTPAWLSSHY